MTAKESLIPIPKDSHFPLENLPYGVFRTARLVDPQIGVAIGDQILNLTFLESQGLLQLDRRVMDKPSLNAFMGMGKTSWQKARKRLQELLSPSCPLLKPYLSDQRSPCFVSQKEASMLMPVEIGDYTDFYSSKDHASNVGMMFRDKNNPLLPNWSQLPIAYHGRASSIVVSGTEIKRPRGQLKPTEDGPPILAPTRRLDYELELAYFIGVGNELAHPIHIDEAMDHVFGLVLMNDWTARDIQRWEYVPLGPFISKSFATSISPWVVTMEALAPFRCPGPEQDPVPLEYLREKNRKQSHIDLDLDVELQTSDGQSCVLSKSNAQSIYWSMAQQIAQHTVAGCNLRCGDLLASGTISGKERSSFGSLLEISWGGQNPFVLPNGKTRSFLEDGDLVRMSAVARGKSYQIGFGSVEGRIVAAD